MAETNESQLVVDQLGKKPELANNFPEILANPPLENTSFVFSIPIMGEWKNGNALRMLRAMFSQRTKVGQSFEIELIANIGSKLESILASKVGSWGFQTDESGNYIISDPSQDTNEIQANARKLLDEMAELKAFLVKILLAQKLARELVRQPKNKAAKTQLGQLLESVIEPLQKEVLELAIRKSESVSLAVIDATKTVFYQTSYQYFSISALRTLGADVASVRFGDKKDRVILGIFDADTVPENNHAVRDLQQLFDTHNGLNYVFSGMTNLPAGHSADFVGDAPRENIRRTWSYNSVSAYGSPQISFKLRAYEKLQELSGWINPGFYGDEDRDTAIRLIYHFGALQEGLLLESSANLHLIPPTAMTADRLDGTVDSAARRINFAQNGTGYLTADLGSVYRFREELLQKIDQLPQDQRQQTLDFLQKTREMYEKKQKVQRRLNRLVLTVFIDMVKKGAIRLDSDELVIDKNEITNAIGGDALLHYLEANPDVAKSVLTSENDIEVFEYFLGKRESLPEGAQLSPFQKAIREYVGNVLPLGSLDDSSIVSVSQVKNETYTRWVAEDHRDQNSKDSLMHTVIAETLALGYTNRIFFETKKFLQSTKSMYYQWPENPDEQELKMNFGEQTDRLKIIQTKIPIQENQTSNYGVQQNWYQRFYLDAFPIFKLFKYFSV